MLKIISMFPQSKKDKQTSTSMTITTQDHLYQSSQYNTSKYSIKRELMPSKVCQQTHSDSERLMKLSSPKKGSEFGVGVGFKNFSYIEKSYDNNSKELTKDKTQIMTKSLFFDKKSINYQKENFPLAPSPSTKSSFHPDQSPTSPKFRIKKHSTTTFKHTRQLKQQKKNLSYIDTLNSSNLSSIYSSLYNDYQNTPFNEMQNVEPQLNELVDSVMKEQKEKDDGLMKKERKQFQMKQLQFQKNLRKEIKSLTRDTDHILSREFRDMRDVGGK